MASNVTIKVRRRHAHLAVVILFIAGAIAGEGKSRVRALLALPFFNLGLSVMATKIARRPWRWERSRAILTLNRGRAKNG